MADLTKFQPRSGNIFENLGSLRDQLRGEELDRVGRRRYERSKEEDSEGVSSEFNNKYGEDASGELRDVTLDEYLSGFTKDEVQAATKKYGKKVGIKNALEGGYGPQGDTTMGDLGLTVPKDRTFKTKAEAKKFARDQVGMQMIRDKADRDGISITPLEGGGKRGYAELQAYVRDAENQRAEKELDAKTKAAQTRKWGDRTSTQSQGVSGVVSPGTAIAQGPGPGRSPLLGEGASPEAIMEVDTHQSGLDVNTATIDNLRKSTGLERDKFNYGVTKDQEDRNYGIKLKEMEAQALADQRDSENAHAITLHDLQHDANMQFFDKKQDAYNQERNMGYIQGGLGALMSLFML